MLFFLRKLYMMCIPPSLAYRGLSPPNQALRSEIRAALSVLKVSHMAAKSKMVRPIMLGEQFLYINFLSVGLRHFCSKFLQQIEISNKKCLNVSKAHGSLESTKLSSLSLRINEPYWLIHQGNCEHFLVIDQIRSVL